MLPHLDTWWVDFLFIFRPVRRRVSALEDLQEEYDELHSEYLSELAALQDKYAGLYEPVLKKRAAHIEGTVPAPEATEDEDADEDEGETENDGGTVGIPDFWLCALRNHEGIAPSITEKDEGVLKYLKDITTAKLSEEDREKDEESDKKDSQGEDGGEEEEGVEEEEEEDEEEEPVRGFSLTFHFLPNPYFKNLELKKKYFMIDEEDPILEKATGTEIEWNSGWWP